MRSCSDTNIDPVTLWKDTKIILMVEGISLARRGSIAVFVFFSLLWFLSTFFSYYHKRYSLR